MEDLAQVVPTAKRALEQEGLKSVYEANKTCIKDN